MDGLAESIMHIEKRINRLRFLIVMQSCLLAAFAFFAYVESVHAKNQPDIMHVRGLVVDDVNGRARILLGAPFPQAQSRKRQDATTEGLVFLDEKGNDRLVVGEAPEPNVNGKVGHRAAQEFGVIIHDTNGAERGGFGWLANGRAVISLDRPEQDAWAAVVDDKTGSAYMVTYFSPSVSDRFATGIISGTQGTRSFIRIKSTNDVDRAVLQVAEKNKLSFDIFDSAGRPVKDLVEAKCSKESP